MKKKINFYGTWICVLVGVLLLSSCSLHPFEAMKLTKLGDEAYQNEDFIGAETYHKKSYDLSQDEGVLLKLGNDYYADKKYEDAASVYGQVQSQDMQHEAIWWHNLGNTEYRLGEGETDTEKKIQYWKQSIASYEASLAIEEKDTTQENKAFVEEKLKELEEQEQQQSEENKKSGEDTEGWGEQNGDNQEQTGSGETDTGNGADTGEEETASGQEGQETGASDSGSSEGQPSGATGQGSEGDDSLSDEEKKYLEQYTQFLRDQEKQEQGQYNKQSPSGDLQDSFFQPFMGNPFFDDVFNRGGEKDW